ncbi:MAG TPA: UDP-N-acetylmuramoyl-L-alanyl-D-glutamate--2,6-diaminopimelate ligase, partial [Candidatus Limnocylindria bacterium]|nr:UDP-N-acetylmuramoyl-L-alanyl-D-glutamate--2,6-diaminopimelate ligase [Candidatus Limnocylindria bacterium]
MTLTDLLEVLRASGAAPTVSGSAGEVTLVGVTSDSRTVVAGDLYAALPGAHHHGAAFVSSAVGAGAVAVLTDLAGASAAQSEVPVIVVDDPRAVLGEVAAAVLDHPSRRLLTLGVTGTNGKTTTTYLLDAGLRAAGHRTGLVGTVETRVGDTVVPSIRTTPEAPDLQRLLARMVLDGCSAVSMEVSSHALALGRVDGTTYDVALFTNLSQDHLDFHSTMEDYFAAKAQLFTPRYSRHAVIDVDSAWGRRLALEASVPVTTLSAAGASADWQVRDVVLTAEGSTWRTLGPSGEDVGMSVALPGPFNVSNALGALVTLSVAGVPVVDAAEGIAGLAGVPGRMERVEVGQPFLAVVDYAHTPDAVATLLAAVRTAVSGPVVVVLGCGGDRDPHKRPAMGAAAVAGADLVVLTSDNPRSEDPLVILAAMRAGAEEAAMSRPGTDVVVEPDRAAAVALAVGRAVPGGAVVVAGKGHETGQETG